MLHISSNSQKYFFFLLKHQNEFMLFRPFRDVFFNNQTGERLKYGDIIYPQKSLCNTYKTLAETDGNDFYSGNLADLIVDDLRDLGSIITKDDLQNYR